MEAWIRSNAGEGGLWHLATEHTLNGAVTGKVLSRYFLTACSNRQLGGAWGYEKRVGLGKPDDGVFCSRCEALAKKAAP